MLISLGTGSTFPINRRFQCDRWPDGKQHFCCGIWQYQQHGCAGCHCKSLIPKRLVVLAHRLLERWRWVRTPRCHLRGSSDNSFETTLTVTDPTADRTITLPNVTGTVVTTGDTGSVTSTMILDGTIANADISTSAEIAVSKLANGTARQLLQTDSGGSGVEFT